MGDVALLEVVADARAADAVDALPVALPRAAQYTGFASMLGLWQVSSVRRTTGAFGDDGRTEIEHPLLPGALRR